MKKVLKLGLLIAALFAPLLAVRAEKTPVAVSAANEAKHTISLPDNLKVEAVITAVSKAFGDVGWSSVTVDKQVVTASLQRHDIKVTATAVCTASEVKVAAAFDPGPNTPEKAKAAVHRWLRTLDKNSKEELGLSVKSGKKDRKTVAD